MSQIAKAIMATDTGERRFIPQGFSPLFQDVFSSRADVGDLYNPQIATMYRIGVTLGASAMVEDRYRMMTDSALTHAIDRTKRQVIEAVFGEFRPLIRQLEKEIYNYNYEEAGKLLYQLERQMFEEK